MSRVVLLIFLMFSAFLSGLAMPADIPAAVTQAHASVVRVIITRTESIRNLAPLLDRAPIISLDSGNLKKEGIFDFSQLVEIGAVPVFASVETQGVVLDDGETVVIPRDVFKTLKIKPQVGVQNFNAAILSGTGELLMSSGRPFPPTRNSAVEVVWDRHLLLQEGPAQDAFFGHAPSERGLQFIDSPILLRIKGGVGVSGIKAKPVTQDGYYPGQRDGLCPAYALTLSYSPSVEEALCLPAPIRVQVTEEESLIDEAIELIPRRHGRMDLVSEAQLYMVWDRYISPKQELPRGSAIVDSSGRLLLVTMADHVRQPRSFMESATGYGVCGGWLALMARNQVKFLKPSVAGD